MTITERLAEYVVGLQFDDIPPEVVGKAKDHLVHAIGVALRGRATDMGRQGIEVALTLSGGTGPCSIIGDHRRADSLEAIFANSLLMEHDGMDDAVLPPGVHPGIVTQPVAWALGEVTKASGRELLTAIIAGYDVMTKLCNPIWTWTLDPPRRPNSVTAPFGAAATAARLLGLSPTHTAHALGHAGHGGMGIVEGSGHMWTLSPLLARNGAMAAILAEAGMESASTMIEGRHGVYRSFFFQDVPPALDETLATLGREFEISRAIIKRQSGSAFNVIPIELTHQLVDQHRLGSDRIERIVVTLPAERAPREAEWEAAVLGPDATYANRSGSLRFRVAAMVTDGVLDPARYETPPTGSLLEVIEKVHLDFRAGLPIAYARIDVTTTDGERLTAEGDDIVVGLADWDEWLRVGGEALLSNAQLARLVELVGDLENVADVSEVAACFVGRQAS